MHAHQQSTHTHTHTHHVCATQPEVPHLESVSACNVSCQAREGLLARATHAHQQGRHTHKHTHIQTPHVCATQPEVPHLEGVRACDVSCQAREGLLAGATHAHQQGRASGHGQQTADAHQVVQGVGEQHQLQLDELRFQNVQRARVEGAGLQRMLMRIKWCKAWLNSPAAAYWATTPENVKEGSVSKDLDVHRRSGGD
eukprot:1158208-Pelagomonas_calceolata.AAC.18